MFAVLRKLVRVILYLVAGGLIERAGFTDTEVEWIVGFLIALGTLAWSLGEPWLVRTLGPTFSDFLSRIRNDQ